MKFADMVKTFLLAFVCFSVSVTEGNAQSRKIPAGYYKGKFADREAGFYDGKLLHQRDGADVEIFIIRRKVGTFGVIAWERDEEKGGALFRIDETSDGTQYWKHIIQRSDFVLTNYSQLQASYRVQMIAGTHGDPKIRFTPTPTGKIVGCKDTIEAEYDDDGPRVASLPKDVMVLEDADDAEGTMSPNVLSGRFFVNGNAFDGDYQLESWEPQVPGLMTAYARSEDPESASGVAVEDKIAAVILTLFDDNGIWQGYYKAHVIDLGVNHKVCYAPRGEVEEE